MELDVRPPTLPPLPFPTLPADRSSCAWLVLRKSVGNMRLQEMMGIMASERGGKLYATDERCVPSLLPLLLPLSPNTFNQITVPNLTPFFSLRRADSASTTA